MTTFSNYTARFWNYRSHLSTKDDFWLDKNSVLLSALVGRRLFHWSQTCSSLPAAENQPGAIARSSFNSVSNIFNTSFFASSVAIPVSEISSADWVWSP